MIERRPGERPRATGQPVRATVRADLRGSTQPMLVLEMGRPVFANDSCARLFGVPEPANLLAGGDWRPLVAPADRATAARLFEETLTAFRVLKPGGGVVPILCMASDMEWQGRTARLLTFIDDTERWRRAEWQADLSWALDSISRGYALEAVLGILVAACERAEPDLDIALVRQTPEGSARLLARRRLPERLLSPLVAAVGSRDRALGTTTADERFMPLSGGAGPSDEPSLQALGNAGYGGLWVHMSTIRGDDQASALVALSRGAGPPDPVARTGLSTGARLAALTLAQARTGSALRASEARTARSRSQLVEGIESLDDGFALWDADDRLLLCNDRFREISRPFAGSVRIGATLESILRAGLATGAFPEASGREEEWLAERMRHHRHPEAPLTVRRSGGGWIRVVERQTRDGGIVTVYTDVTESLRREQELRAAKEEAERASQAKSTFLAQMSHELRTPLNAIIGFAELVMRRDRGDGPDDPVREYLSDIHDSAHHLLALINDILDLAKVESGRMELDEQVVDLAEVIASATSGLAVLADAAGVRVTSAADGVGPMRGDRRKLRQVLINVISNAIKYSPRGSTVAVSLAREAGRLVVRVTDAGTGMSPAEIAEALEPFEQVTNAINLTTRGTGLGLPLSLALMHLHGGTLAVESEPGAGTTVVLGFPAHRTVTLSGRR